MSAPSGPDPSSVRAAAMVRALGVLDPRIARAMRQVPRERFVPSELAERAYDDEPLSLCGLGSTISAPHMVALQLEALAVQPGLKVLEVGSGSGYLLALLAELVGPTGRVVGVERVRELAKRSQELLRELGYGAYVEVEEADGRLGWPAGAPYDRIVVSAAAARLFPQWRAQLREGGRMVVPLGPASSQRLLTVRAGPDGDRFEMGPECRFVPLVGAGSPHI